MLIQGSPISVELPSDPGLQDRFWYWQGASGAKYIHSVYAPDQCPPLPGAVYVGVKRHGSLLVALCVGRFKPFWDGTLARHDLARLAALGADEIHVHLLAKSPALADAIHADLKEAMSEPVMEFGFSETPLLRAA